ncbi:hypothetical protein [Herbiconiux sp.]|uniref:hypothetical protein n=1 Tax=Herbiconiux sp. TaxID=1871186 RepID=UPI0025C33204|nr:hypothetical protein [Herbiconiux sp.]
MSRTSEVTTTSRPLSTAALVLGIAAAAVAALGWVPLTLAPGDPVTIGVVTALSYLLPLAGVVVGHVARRREGGQVRATVGLVLSYLALAAVVVPLVVGLFSLAVAP